MMVGGLWPISGRPAITPFTALIRFKHRPLVYQPGESTLYSSYAFVLLSAVIERAGGEPFVEQVERRIAEPLEMKSLQLDFETRDQPHWSVGYLKNSAGKIVRAREEANYWKYGAGGYKSNIQDFARWAAALINHELVSAETERQMWTPQRTSRGDTTTRGLGFVVEDENGLKVSHGGSQPEAKSRLVIYPAARHGVVVLSNCSFANPVAISTAVYRALRDER
jgi:serine beta-lactamase-like protein LACTB, mitochondrial